MERNLRAPFTCADSVGVFARCSLTADPSGTVLASHSRATYLLSASAEVLWLAPVDVPMHRRGVRVAGSLPRTAKGSTYQVADARLLLGDGTAIDLGAALAWEPERWSDPRHPSWTVPGRAADSAPDLLDGLPSPRGLGTLLPALTELARGGMPPSRAPQPTPLLAHAAPSVFGLARACREGDGAALLEHAAALVGLGEGLTPSGDDFVGGVLFGLAALRETGGRLSGCSPRALASFLDFSRRRTNRVSYALLADHVAGHGCEPAHRLVLALLGRASPETTRRAASDLVRVGHSTGWDVLTGLWTAWALTPSDEWLIRRPAAATAFAATIEER